MVCGDSKTAIPDGRYRIYVQEIFDSENKRVTWVGVINGALGGDPVGMQSWMSAASGARVAEMRSLVAGTPTTIVNTGVLITPAPLSAAPNVIVIWLGTNDLIALANAEAGVSEATIEASYLGFIGDMHTRWPTAKIVCVNIDQNYTGVATVYNPATFNAFLAALPGNPTYSAYVTVVDVHTNLGFSALYGDGLHPLHPPADWIIAMKIWQGVQTFVG